MKSCTEQDAKEWFAFLESHGVSPDDSFAGYGDAKTGRSVGGEMCTETNTAKIVQFTDPSEFGISDKSSVPVPQQAMQLVPSEFFYLGSSTPMRTTSSEPY